MPATAVAFIRRCLDKYFNKFDSRLFSSLGLQKKRVDPPPGDARGCTQASGQTGYPGGEGLLKTGGLQRLGQGALTALGGMPRS